MRLVVLSLLVACGGSEPAPAPKEADAPKEKVEQPPEEEPEVVPDFAAMSEEDAKAWLMKKGQEVYKTGGRDGVACMTCHMEDGKGSKGAFPPLVGQKEHMGDCTHHAGLIINGLSGDITVDGVKYSSAMPPQPKLTDVEIAAVTTYERHSWGNDYGVCLPDDVKKAR